MEPTPEQKRLLATIAKLIFPNFACFIETHTSDGIKLVNEDGNPIIYLFDWHTVTEYLRAEFSVWARQRQNALFNIAYPGVSKQFKSMLAFDSGATEPIENYDFYQSRQVDLFGDHRLLNQDDETDGY